MKSSSIFDAFSQWLQVNRERLPVRVVELPAREGDSGRRYRLEGVPSLRITLDSFECLAEVYQRRQFVIDFLVADLPQPKRRKDGRYFCSECKSLGRVEYAKDRLSLLTSHTFEPFLAWCLEKIREDNLLVVERKRGWTTARILSPAELRASKRRLWPGAVVEPLLRKRTGR
jgi:hypothetical protein